MVSVLPYFLISLELQFLGNIFLKDCEHGDICLENNPQNFSNMALEIYYLLQNQWKIETFNLFISEL